MIYLDPLHETIQYNKDREDLIPIPEKSPEEIDKMKYEAVKLYIKTLMHKILTKPIK
jgi:hypothetical protein